MLSGDWFASSNERRIRKNSRGKSKREALMKLEVVSGKADKKTHQVPILFAHGAWHGAWCYQKYFMPYFAEQGFDTYALSYRDHGGSEKSGMRTNRIRDYVIDLGQVIDTLPQKPILIAHSMGGHVAQKYLEEQQLPATVLLAPVPAAGVWSIMLYAVHAYAPSACFPQGQPDHEPLPRGEYSVSIQGALLFAGHTRGGIQGVFLPDTG
jgi:pimeloyl-ACP methyl ester carboxylesterase